jgi:mono/diheme cytochrome c family protein
VLKPCFVLLFVLVPTPLALSSQQPAAAPSSPPVDAKQLVNPVKTTPESIAKAKKQYGYDCAMCHGANGNGKGDLVEDMKLTLKDYTDPAALSGMSDGDLYTIIKDGKGKMPGDGGRTKPDDLWGLVNLVRSFAKK